MPVQEQAVSVSEDAGLSSGTDTDHQSLAGSDDNEDSVPTDKGKGRVAEAEPVVIENTLPASSESCK